MFIPHNILSSNFLLIDVHDTQCPMIITPSAQVTGNVFGDKNFVILNYDEVLLQLGNPQLVHDSALGKVKMVCAQNHNAPQCEIWIPAKYYPINLAMYTLERLNKTFQNLTKWRNFRTNLDMCIVNGAYPELDQELPNTFL